MKCDSCQKPSNLLFSPKSSEGGNVWDDKFVNSGYFLFQLFMVTKLGLCLVYFEEKLQDLLISVTKLLCQIL